MGNAALRDLSIIEEISLSDLEGKVVAVDAHNWLYKYMTIMVRYTDDREYTKSDGTELPAVLGCIKGIPRFYQHNIVPVFVFDGAYHELKEDEIQERKEKKQVAQQEYSDKMDDGDIIQAAKYESRSARLTSDMIDSVKALLDILGLEYLEAPQAGETQAAYMTQETPSIYACASDDYDSLLFGSVNTIRNITSPDKLERLPLEATKDELDLTQEELVDVALLCGTDYNDGIHGYGPKTSVKAVKNGEQEDIFIENDVPYEVLRDLFLNPEVKEVTEVQQTLPNPSVDELQTFLLEDLEFPEDSIMPALDKIRDSTEQPGLSEWT